MLRWPILAFAIFMASNNPIATGWQDLAIGGGGFATGLSIANDGTIVTKSDTYGGYLKTGSTWQQLVTSNSMPAGSVSVGNTSGGGTYEIEVCKSNSQILYIIPGDGWVYRSANQGASWTKTTKQLTGTLPIGLNQRGRFMACDPADTTGNNLIIGGPSVKPSYTTDGGTTWTSLSTLATASSNGSAIAYDATTSSGGATPTIYIMVDGTGVYKTTAGPSGTWTLTTSGPTTYYHLICVGGVAYVADGNSGTPWKFNGSWSHLSGTGLINNTYTTIAVDPNNTNHIVLGSFGAFLAVSSDGGVTWLSNTTTPNQSPSEATTINGDQPWTAGTYGSGSGVPYLTNGDMQFDPSGVLWLGWGFGIMHANPYASTTTITWTAQVTGTEQIVAGMVFAGPSGDILLGGNDIGAFHKTAATVANNATVDLPSAAGTGPNGQLRTGFSFDYAPGSTSFIVGLFTGNSFESTGSDWSGTSSDGGQTWTQFTHIPSGAGAGNPAGGSGNIGVASTTNFVWIPGGYNTSVYYTTDGGTTWNTASGISGTFVSASFFPAAQYLAASKANPGTMYAYLQATGSASPGVYKTTNLSSWSRVFTSELDNHDNAQMIFKIDPISDDLWYTSGYQSGATHPVAMSFYRSINGGTSFTIPNSNLQEVLAFGFGPQVPGQSWSYIGVLGWVSGVYGFWESADRGVTYTQLGTTYPNGWYNVPNSVDGDKTTAHQWYMSINGAGFKYYH